MAEASFALQAEEEKKFDAFFVLFCLVKFKNVLKLNPKKAPKCDKTC